MNTIRCRQCNARLFDTDSAQGDRHAGLVIVQIKCWRCRALVRVYLFVEGDRVGEGYAMISGKAADRRSHHEATQTG